MVCTLLRLTPAEWSSDQVALMKALSMVRQVMDELMLVGRAMGYDEALIPSNTPDMIMARSMELLKDSNFVFSALLDVRLGKPFELEVILGEAVRQAQKCAASVPVSLYFIECQGSEACSWWNLSTPRSQLFKRTSCEPH